MFALDIEPGLRLALLHRGHAQTLLSLVDMNREYLRQWLAWVDAHKDVTVTERVIESTLQQYANQLGFQAGIFLQGALVGITGFKPIDPVNRIGEIGYWVSQNHQGQGIMHQVQPSCGKGGI